MAGVVRRDGLREEAREDVRVGTLRGDERCHRCGGENVNWCAPSPLWNLVMRGNDINGDPRYDDLVCIRCFVVLAEEAGVRRGQWRLFVDPEPYGLVDTTPSGRIWDAESWMWREPADALDAVPDVPPTELAAGRSGVEPDESHPVDPALLADEGAVQSGSTRNSAETQGTVPIPSGAPTDAVPDVQVYVAPTNDPPGHEDIRFPDVPPDPPAVDRDELARALAEAQGDHQTFDEGASLGLRYADVEHYRELADALLSSGVLVDAADVRARYAEELARDILREGGEDFRYAATWLRDRAVSEREGTS